MSTAHNPESTDGPGAVEKLATGAVLTAGLSLAVMGLGAGAAHADPDPTLQCPVTALSGARGTVTVANLYSPSGTNPIFVSDGPNLEKYVGPGWGSRNGAMAVTWPSQPIGQHTLTAWQANSAGSATCTIDVVATQPPYSAPGGGGGGGAVGGVFNQTKRPITETRS